MTSTQGVWSSSVQLDPDLFEVRPGVPVADAFREDRNGTTIEVDGELLRRIEARMQEIEASGNLCPLVLGHVDFSLCGRGDYQNPVVGYAKNFRYGNLDDGNPAIFADYWLLKEKIPDIKDRCGLLPRWSAEIWRSQAEIDPIALLGATTPFRRLGTIQLSRPTGEQPITCAKFTGELLMPVAPSPDQTKPTAGAASMEGKLDSLISAVAQLSELLTKSIAPAAASPAPSEPPVSVPSTQVDPGNPEDEISDEELQRLLEGMEAGAPKEEPAEKPKKAKKKEDGEDGDDKPSQLSRMQVQLDKFTLEKTIRGIRDTHRLTLSDAEIEEEAASIAEMPEKFRATQLSRIEKRYARAGLPSQPLDFVIQSVDPVPLTQKGAPTQTQMKQILQLSRQGQISYEAAYLQVMGVPLGSRNPGQNVKYVQPNG